MQHYKRKVAPRRAMKAFWPRQSWVYRGFKIIYDFYGHMISYFYVCNHTYEIKVLLMIS